MQSFCSIIFSAFLWLKFARFREDLDADSLDLVELIMEFEEKFGGEISDEEAQKITTVGEAVSYLDSHKTHSP